MDADKLKAMVYSLLYCKQSPACLTGPGVSLSDRFSFRVADVCVACTAELRASSALQVSRSSGPITVRISARKLDARNEKLGVASHTLEARHWTTDALFKTSGVCCAEASECYRASSNNVKQADRGSAHFWLETHSIAFSALA